MFSYFAFVKFVCLPVMFGFICLLSVLSATSFLRPLVFVLFCFVFYINLVKQTFNYSTSQTHAPQSPPNKQFTLPSNIYKDNYNGV